jgi:hypothetical protein
VFPIEVEHHVPILSDATFAVRKTGDAGKCGWKEEKRKITQ